MAVSLISRKRVGCWFLTMAIPLLVFGQTDYVPQGGEYAVAGVLPGDQVWPGVALGTSGGYVVWQDNVTDGSGWGISAQGVDSSLSGTLFSSFRVNEQGAGDQAGAQDQDVLHRRLPCRAPARGATAGAYVDEVVGSGM